MRLGLKNLLATIRKFIGWPDNGFSDGATQEEIFRVSQRLGLLMFVLLFGGIVVFIYLAYD